jgi:L-aspartate oxidase
MPDASRVDTPMPAAVRIVRSPSPLVVGSGIGGLSAALGLAGCTVITAARIGAGSSRLAQGGVAAAMGDGDTPALHARDTVSIGGRIVDGKVADLVTRAAEGRVTWWRGLGAEFDSDGAGEVRLGREAGHSRRRIVHAGGDATGAEIMRVLRLATLGRPDITLVPRTRLVDLVRGGDRIAGILTREASGELVVRLAPAVILATGGIGGVYRRSTNPLDVTGAGLAAAARQGALLADLEFVQFHPTALATRDHPAPLLTEALRGEGATLVDETGARFMAGVHPEAELAPRDVVARAIWTHLRHGHRVYLDAARAVGAALPERFPTVFALASRAGIDARVEPIPVSPAEHFHMGGVATDEDGRTSLEGLWAVGEVASTGLHGANRLASNSLLEAAVMGQRAADAIARSDSSTCERSLLERSGDLLVPESAFGRALRAADGSDGRVREIAWSRIGIVRSGDGLRGAIEAIDAIGGVPTDAATVARLIATAALDREESRGAHYRSDHPESDPAREHRSMLRPRIAPLTSLGGRLVGAVA